MACLPVASQSKTFRKDRCDKPDRGCDENAAQRIAADSGLEISALTADGFGHFVSGGGNRLCGSRHVAAGFLLEFAGSFAHRSPCSISTISTASMRTPQS